VSKYQEKGDTTVILPIGLETWDGDKIRCQDCGRWEYLRVIAGGKEIRHSKRCDTGTLQLKAPASVRAADGSLEALQEMAIRTKGNGMSTEALLAAVDRGYLSVSDAMNTDY
jgi:hypothetical protein